MADAGIGLRRLASQRIAAGRLDEPADVVRWLGALQAQDYQQSLWAIGTRGTIHFAASEDVRWLTALCTPRLLAADEKRCAQIGLSQADIERSAEPSESPGS